MTDESKSSCEIPMPTAVPGAEINKELSENRNSLIGLGRAEYLGATGYRELSRTEAVELRKFACNAL